MALTRRRMKCLVIGILDQSKKDQGPQSGKRVPLQVISIRVLTWPKPPPIRTTCHCLRCEMNGGKVVDSVFFKSSFAYCTVYAYCACVDWATKMSAPHHYDRKQSTRGRLRVGPALGAAPTGRSACPSCVPHRRATYAFSTLVSTTLYLGKLFKAVQS